MNPLQAALASQLPAVLDELSRSYWNTGLNQAAHPASVGMPQQMQAQAGPAPMLRPPQFELSGEQWDGGMGAVPGDIGYQPPPSINPAQDYGGAQGILPPMYQPRNVNGPNVQAAMRGQGMTGPDFSGNARGDYTPKYTGPFGGQNGVPAPSPMQMAVEQALAMMGLTPGEQRENWMANDPTSPDPMQNRVSGGQEQIDRQLDARFQPAMAGLNPAAADYANSLPDLRRQYQQGITANMDATQAAGERRGYGTTPFAYMDNQIVDPAALQPMRSMNPAEIMASQQGLQGIRNAGGTVNQNFNPAAERPADSRVILPRETGQPANFREGAGAAYVDAQRQMLDMMKAGVDPAKLPRNTLQGAGMSPDQRAAYDTKEAGRKKAMNERLTTSRAKEQGRRDTNATIAKARREGMNPLMRRLMETQGADGQQQGTIMDALYPEQAIERKKLEALTGIERDKLAATQRGQDMEDKRLTSQQGIDQQKMTLAVQELAARIEEMKRAGDLQRGELDMKREAARNAPFIAGLGSQNPDVSEWGMSNIGGGGQQQGPPGATKTMQSVGTAKSPEEALGYLLANPQIVDNPELLRKTIQGSTATLSPEMIQQLLKKYDPDQWSNFNTSRYSTSYPDTSPWRKILYQSALPLHNLWDMTIGAEDPQVSAVRQQKVALLRKLQGAYTGR